MKRAEKRFAFFFFFFFSQIYQQSRLDCFLDGESWLDYGLEEMNQRTRKVLQHRNISTRGPDSMMA